MINAKFSHITERTATTFNVIFKADDGKNLNTICKWIKNNCDVNSYVSLDNGYVVGLNDKGKYSISETERLKAVDAVFNYNAICECGNTKEYLEQSHCLDCINEAFLH